VSELLACRGVTVRFGGLTALDGLDLAVGRGQILGLIGPNGSGKTTLFNAVTGIYEIASGEIVLDGRDISQLSPQNIYRAGIARTFQRSRLCLPLTVFDNIMIGNHQRLDNGLWFNLFRRGLLREQFEENFAKARLLVKTFNANLAERLFSAAGALGMIDRRRVEICRALVSEPKLLLLDEPSAGMTREETRELMDDILLARDRIKGLTIIIIEHEMSVIERITEHCAVLNYGKKICEGAFREVAADLRVQEAYLGQAVAGNGWGQPRRRTHFYGLRQGRRADGCQHYGAHRRDHLYSGFQRLRKIDAGSLHTGAYATTRGPDCFRRTGTGRTPDPSGDSGRNCVHPGGTQGFSQADGRGKSTDRRLPAKGRQRDSRTF
jgi:ABC-type branched-subunit amino acid transport system ATPase component